MVRFGGRGVSGGDGYNPQDYEYNPRTPEVVYGQPQRAPAAPATPAPTGTSKRPPSPRAARPRYNPPGNKIRITSSSGRGDLIQRTKLLAEKDAEDYVAEAVGKAGTSIWDALVKSAMWYEREVRAPFVSRPLSTIALAGGFGTDYTGNFAKSWRDAPNISPAQAMSLGFSGANEDADVDVSDPEAVKAFFANDSALSEVSTSIGDTVLAVFADPLLIAGKAAKVTKLTYFGRRAEGLDNVALKQSMESAVAGRFDPVVDPWHAVAKEVTSGRRVDGSPAPYDRAAVMNLDVVRQAAEPERAADFLVAASTPEDAVVRMAHLRGVTEARDVMRDMNPTAYFDAMAAEATAAPYLDALSILDGSKGSGWRWTPDGGFEWQSWVGSDEKKAVLDRLIAPTNEADLAYAVRMNEEARTIFEQWRRVDSLFNTSDGGRAYGRRYRPGKQSKADTAPATVVDDVLDGGDELADVSEGAPKRKVEAEETSPALRDRIGLTNYRPVERVEKLLDKAMGTGRAGKREAKKARRELRAADSYWWGRPETMVWKVPGLNRSVVEVKRAFDEMPTGYVPFKGAGAEDAVPAVKSSIRNVPVYAQAKLRNKTYKWADGTTSTGAERGRWLMNQWIARSASSGVTREEGLRRATLWMDNQIWNDLIAAKGLDAETAKFAMEEYSKVRNALDNNISVAQKAGGFWTDMDDAGRAVSTHDPVLASQLDNGTLLLNHRQAWDVIDDAAVAERSGFRYKTPGMLKHDAVVVGDALMNVWKPLVLLRAAYPIRNGFEGQTRFLAEAGGTLRYLDAVFQPGSTKRPQEAASAARRALDEAVKEIDALDAYVGKIDLATFERIPHVPAELQALAVARSELMDRQAYLAGLLDAGGTVDSPVIVQARAHPGIMFEEAIGNGATGMMPTKQLKMREDPNGLDPSQVTAYADELEAGVGFDKPLLIALDPDTGEVRLVDGLHRMLAAEAVGVSHVPVRVIVGRGSTGPLLRKVNKNTLAASERQLIESSMDDAPWDPLLARPSDTTAMPLPGGAFALPDGSRLVQARDRGKLTSGYQRAVLDKDGTWVRGDDVFATPEEAALEVQGRMVAEWTGKVNDQSIPALAAEVAFPGQRWAARPASKMWDDQQAKIFKERLRQEKFTNDFESTVGRQLDLVRGRMEAVDARTRMIFEEMGFIDGKTGDLAMDWEYLGRPQYAADGAVYGDGTPAQTADSMVLPDRHDPTNMALYYMPVEARDVLAKWANTLLAKADLKAAARSLSRQAEYFDNQTGRLRRGRGMGSMVDQTGHRYDYGGMFSDSRAGRLVESEVSSASTTEAMTTSAAYGSAYKKIGRDFDIARNVKVSPDEGEKYWEAMAKVINHHWRGDSAIGILLKADTSSFDAAKKTLPEFYEFIKSSQGQRYVDLFDLTDMQKAREWWMDTAQRVDSMLPGNPKMRAKIARGEEVTADELREGLDFGERTPPTITGDVIKSLPGSQSFAKAKLLGSLGALRDKGFKWMGTIPEDVFTRDPYAHWAYDKHLQQLMDQRLGDRISTAEWVDMQKAATKLAIRDSRRNLYTIIRKRRAFEAVRFGAAFAEAQFNSLAFWSRTMAENPDYVARLLQIASLPAKNGMVDTDGNVAVPIPLGLGANLPGSPDTMDLPVSSITSLYFNTGNRENPLLGGILPSATPLVAVPASEFAKSPTGQWLVDKFGENAVMQIAMSQVLGDTTQAEFLSWNRASPAWLPKVAHLINEAALGADADSYMMATQIQAFEIDHIRWQMEGGKGKQPLPSDEKYRNDARGMALLRIATNVFAPLSVQWGNKDHQRASDLYRSITEAYGPTEADQIMLQMYPEYVSLLASANSGGGVASRASTNKWINDNRGILAELGEIDTDAARLLVPWAEGEFQEEAYVWQKANKWPGTDDKIRGTLAAEDAEGAWEKKIGLRLYRLERDRLLIEREQNGVEPGTAEWDYYKQQLDFFTNDLMKRLPGFKAQWQDEGEKQTLAAKGVKALTVIAESKKLAEDPEFAMLVDTARDYLDARDFWADEASKNGEWYYAQNEAVRTAYEKTVESMERRDPKFSQIYGTYFFWDDMSVRSDGSRSGSDRLPGEDDEDTPRRTVRRVSRRVASPRQVPDGEADRGVSLPADTAPYEPWPIPPIPKVGGGTIDYSILAGDPVEKRRVGPRGNMAPVEKKRRKPKNRRTLQEQKNGPYVWGRADN